MSVSPSATTATHDEPPASNSSASSQLGPRDLLRRLADCTSRRAAYVAGLAYIAEAFNSPYATITMDVDNHSTEEKVVASEAARKSWARHCDGMTLNARYRENCQARFFQATGVADTFAILSVPLATVHDGTIGALTVVVTCRHRDVAEARLTELQSLAAIIDLQANSVHQRSRTGADGYALSRVAAHKNLDEFCFALTNSLKSNLNCAQVALGLVRKNSVDVVCISGFDALYPRTPGTRLVQQAMCECLDAAEVVCHQTSGETEDIATGYHLHKQWHASMGASPVASIPLYVEQQCVGIVSLCNAAGNPFRQSQLTKVQELVNPLMPGLMLLRRADAGVAQRVADGIRRFLHGFCEPGRWRRQLSAVLTAASICWLICGQITYRITVPCIIEPTNDRQLSAPFEAAISRIYVRPGDHVVAGQTLVQMETTDLVSQRKKLVSQRHTSWTAMMQALEVNDVSKAAQAQADVTTADAELQLVDDKIAVATIQAPSDGVILDGDLSGRVGEIVALGEPMVRFAPEGKWKVVIHIPDRATAEMAPGQSAYLALTARPEISTRLEVTHVHAGSHIEEGTNVFAAEATFLGQPPQWLRGGMRGVARVDLGNRPVWWVWTHRLIDTLRMQAWNF